jgi:hypothetical protein
MKSRENFGQSLNSRAFEDGLSRTDSTLVGSYSRLVDYYFELVHVQVLYRLPPEVSCFCSKLYSRLSTELSVNDGDPAPAAWIIINGFCKYECVKPEQCTVLYSSVSEMVLMEAKMCTHAHTERRIARRLTVHIDKETWNQPVQVPPDSLWGTSMVQDLG